MELSNFVTRKVAASIAAGCSVILKPASETPGTCMHMVEACKKAGLPNGVVNFVTGKSSFYIKISFWLHL